ncbi:site-specific DNA-methyltransferase [Rhodococcus sp. BP-349]|uniref:site-specific DNA-methyltransferase n=1 Tax=unclassified Rhodococcus (in: high G+C Gram-positive bacteria) TaxID=192944 RepID=UPI001DCDE973|nr:MULTISPECIES: site-specific DNA-methyltransferase [unclassified Rhodococcus (in: high G+C Gram-positive bacteria)]MBY6540057.1 site-specific DNA-methyltransferase [Rhodococcus sp. BP-363]MBY6543615.1 site-specific DNA-methyltransferase [Rhodococcus sp. BP-369]MBY6562845.1 site-specific DNA-methyltransferase [Rhodococcus sp. BP-370]MBY6577137.1 site-specific DNA-methyltransferase [Rhodococcus sp. BP-364]MBY6586438.1 site-specific DNA-methyltransferase [Rhodococcus sp. BP-358]
MEKLRMTTPDTTAVNIEKIAEIFPGVMTETVDPHGTLVRVVDFDLLRQELSDQLVEGRQERYQLDWPGKRAAAFTANTPIAKTLRPLREQSVDFDATKNLFVEGDNLDVLKMLQESYLGKVKLIYIDPPYNTGNDLLYDDDFTQTQAEFLVESSQDDGVGSRLVANLETNGRFHSDWLSMMYPRLKLARNLLSEDGVLVVSIDDGEHAGIVEVCKELFGAKNYLASVARVTKKTSNKGTHFAPSKDYLVTVARNADAVGPLMDEIDEAYRRKFSAVDERGAFATVGLYQASLDPLRGCSNQRYWIQCPDGSFVVPPGPRRPNSVEDAANRPPESREDRVWRWSFDTYLKNKKLLIFKETSTSPLQDERGDQSKWNVYTKYYLEDRLADGKRPRDFLDGVTNDQGAKALANLGMAKYFDYTKPPALVRRMLGWIADPDALVLDFFAGSATTGHAVMEQNAADGGRRSFICVQIAEDLDVKSDAASAGFSTISELGRERLVRASAAVAERAGLAQADLDLGFRYLRVDSNNLTDVLLTPDETNQYELAGLQDSVKPGRSGEDLLFQVLLDWGLELTLPITVEQVDGNEIFVVDDGALFACFDSAVSPDLVRSLAKREPLRVVFRDSCFASDDARINAEQIFAEVSPLTDVRAI